MYVKNMSANFQVFRAAGARFKIAPQEVVSMTAEQIGDHTTSFLLSRGVLAKIDEQQAMREIQEAAEKAEEKSEERKVEVKKVEDDTVKQAVVVQCSGIKKNGERCSNMVTVQPEDYAEGEEYFCGTHKKQKKAAVAEPEPQSDAE